jgi:hypothetical protein
MSESFRLRKNPDGVYAVPYRHRRAQAPLILPDQTDAASPTNEQDRHLPERLYVKLGLDGDGNPIPLGAAQPTAVRFVRLAGVFALDDGTVVAAYGCKPEELLRIRPEDVKVTKTKSTITVIDPRSVSIVAPKGKRLSRSRKTPNDGN